MFYLNKIEKLLLSLRYTLSGLHGIKNALSIIFIDYSIDYPNCTVLADKGISTVVLN